MKKFTLFFFFLLAACSAFANHITGGEMYYELIGRNGNTYSYRITLKLYRDCASNGAQLDPSAPIAIFDANNNMVVSNNVPRQQIVTLQLTTPSPCIDNPPPVCYQVGYYEFTADLAAAPGGYTVVYQRCCRISGINNINGNSASIGSTYSAQIPGTTFLATAPENNSARFVGADTVIVCANNNFCYDFGAVDPDAATLGDSLVYFFCPALQGGSTAQPAPNPPQGPANHVPIPYSTFDGFSGEAPMGSAVTLNPRTGLMCGVAPAAGIYVVTVCVTEFRQGVPIATQRKDLQIKVGDCNIADANLRPEYITCDGFNFTFRNESPPSPLINSYFWDFGDGGTSTEASPTHEYLDTGTYRIKLVINRGGECSDSATSLLKVYPGFFPAFGFQGVCANNPTRFFDSTSTVYGVVDSWRWEFGDNATTADTSRLQNPSYTYTQTGTKNVTFIVTNSKGCIDTIQRTVEILDKPPLSNPFKDTLICNGDTLQLNAVGQGEFSWTPNTAIINANTANPLVFPSTTTSYIVRLNDNGCINFDTVRVRVVDVVTLGIMPDTSICLTDSVRLRATGDGLRFQWTPAATLSNPASATPMALPPQGTTLYQVRATIGRCIADASVNVTAVPYPRATAGADQEICSFTSAQLNGSIVGTSFTWTPAGSLDNPNSLTPIARPRTTTQYILAAFDNLGCPKPGRDTVLVTVLPPVQPFAGRDTSVVVGQPLQFTATGGVSYVWTPNTSLSRPDIANPVGIYNGSFDSIRYKVVVTDDNGCFDSAFVAVRIFRTEPQVFVPSAFTPNGDGKNDFFRPIPVGITRIEYFRVFNRWGELVFESFNDERGWDGRIKGKQQGSNTYVWIVKAVDFNGNAVFHKGTVTLIK
jgi:gliding motility-associated-like protein